VFPLFDRRSDPLEMRDKTPVLSLRTKQVTSEPRLCG
jgi:hypothetical protein